MLTNKYLEKKYPYEKEARFFFNHYYGFIENDDGLDRKHYIQKQGLIGFGRYLEKFKVIFPVKEDVIQFIVYHADKSLKEISWVIDILNEFIKYCYLNKWTICNHAFYGTEITRKVHFSKTSLVSDAGTTVEETPFEVTDVTKIVNAMKEDR